MTFVLAILYLAIYLISTILLLLRSKFKFSKQTKLVIFNNFVILMILIVLTGLNLIPEKQTL